MGMLGSYMMIDELTLGSLIGLENDDLFEKIEELNESEEIECYDIDKLWDGLHFLLTGKSASNPIDGNKLSEAIVGTYVFNEDENADFISYTKQEHLSEMIHSLKDININKLKSNFNLAKFRKAKIYPNIWLDDQKDSLFDELIQEYKNVLNFYEKAVEKKANVVVSIY